jgi:RHS repeat-associated protein
LIRTTFHVTAENTRIASIENRAFGNDDGPARQLRFQLSGHLQSTSIELDDLGLLISYEEYFPFGGTSYQAVARKTDVAKRYRFTGKERDDTGLDHFGARYYIPWLGRWTSADPAGIGDGANPYIYVGNCPSNNVDPDGKWKVDWKVAAITVAVAVVVVAVVVVTAGAAIPAVVAAAEGGSALAAAAVAAAPVAETALTAYGTYETTKTVVSLAADVNPDTGKPYTDEEGTRAATGLALSAAASGVGIARSALGKGPAALKAAQEGASKLKGAASTFFAEAKAGAQMLMPAAETAGAPAGLAVEKEVAKDVGRATNFAMSKVGDETKAAVAVSNTGKGVARVAAKETDTATRTVEAMSKAEKKIIVGIGQHPEGPAATHLDLLDMYHKGQWKAMRAAGVSEYQIEILRTGAWQVHMEYGRAVEDVAIYRMLNMKGMGGIIEDTHALPGQFAHFPGMGGRPDLKLFGHFAGDLTTFADLARHETRPLWSGNVIYFLRGSLRVSWWKP